MKMTFITLFCILMLVTKVSWAQPGNLDGDFDADGKLVIDLYGSDDEGFSVVVQPDGKILMAGDSYNGTDYDFAIIRCNTDGSLDNSFNSDGKLTSSIAGTDVIREILLQPDGKIIAAGYSNNGTDNDFTVERYDTNGILDNSFGTGGITVSDFGADEAGFAAALQPDGKIVVAGYAFNGTDNDFAVVRYNTDGSLDSSFSVDGKVTTAISVNNGEVVNAVAVQLDGKIVVAGYSFDAGNFQIIALARYNADGTLDTGFDTDGKVTIDIDVDNDEVSDVVVQSDGKILVAGDFYHGSSYDFVLVRYNTDGTLDNNFGITGVVVTDLGGNEYGYAVTLQPDGKIVLAGTEEAFTDEFAVVRYNTDGSLDSTFSGDGIVSDSIEASSAAKSVAIQPDGKIVTAGVSFNGTQYNLAMARYISGLNVGVVEFSLPENTVIYPNPVQSNEVLEYTLTQDEILDISLYDISGKLVKTMVDHQSRDKGMHRESLSFDQTLPAGNYLLRMASGEKSMSIKLAKL